MVKRLPIIQETQIRSPGWEDPPEKVIATHSSILAWKIPWTEETGRLQFMGLQKSQTWLSDFTLFIFVWYEDCYSSFLMFHICMEYIFPSSRFQSICVFRSKWVSYRQHIHGSCYCIHLAGLCLLVGAFNPFTFKIIIDIYVSIGIFLIDWGWFCRSFSFSCISWLYKSL